MAIVDSYPSLFDRYSTSLDPALQQTYEDERSKLAAVIAASVFVAEMLDDPTLVGCHFGASFIARNGLTLVVKNPFPGPHSIPYDAVRPFKNGQEARYRKFLPANRQLLLDRMDVALGDQHNLTTASSTPPGQELVFDDPRLLRGLVTLDLDPRRLPAAFVERVGAENLPPPVRSLIPPTTPG